jgi:hypothetical protein
MTSHGINYEDGIYKRRFKDRLDIMMGIRKRGMRRSATESRINRIRKLRQGLTTFLTRIMNEPNAAEVDWKKVAERMAYEISV